MRIMYTGLDNRVRVAEANRVKFLEDGFQDTDQINERSSDMVDRPVLVAHIYRSKGGKRLILEAPEDFEMEQSQTKLLRMGYLDLTDCVVKSENQY